MSVEARAGRRERSVRRIGESMVLMVGVCSATEQCRECLIAKERMVDRVVDSESNTTF